jgi:hypothetical protein
MNQILLRSPVLYGMIRNSGLSYELLHNIWKMRTSTRHDDEMPHSEHDNIPCLVRLTPSPGFTEEIS